MVWPAHFRGTSLRQMQFFTQFVIFFAVSVLGTTSTVAIRLAK